VAVVMRRFRVTVDGRTFEVEVEELERTEPPAPVSPSAAVGEAPPPPAPRASGAKTGGVVHAPLPGLVSVVRVTPGQRVEAGQVLCILEAMKMENEIAAPRAGVVETVHVTAGTTVAQGDALVTLA
jgi:biotin carboxyl carrier protein